MKVRLSRRADAEVDKIHAWHEEQRLGLGEEFRAELNRVMALIGDFPESYEVVFDQTRRATLRRFPYLVFYEVFPDIVVVFGVIHGARDPQLWMSRGDV